MMKHFLIQSDDMTQDNSMKLTARRDLNLLEKLIDDTSSYLYTSISINELESFVKECAMSAIDNYIPVGSVNFVEQFLTCYADKKGYYTNEYHIQPLNIPSYLQEQEYLLRNYTVKNSSELCSRVCFRKCADRLSHSVSINSLSNYIMYYVNSLSSQNSMFIESDKLDLLSTYKVFISKYRVVSVQCTSSNALSFPSGEFIDKVVKIIEKYNPELTHYILDIGVVEQGTCLLQVRNAVAFLFNGFYNNSLFDILISGFELEKRKMLEVLKHSTIKCVYDSAMQCIDNTLSKSEYSKSYIYDKLISTALVISCEEISELLEVILSKGSKEHITEELADVFVCLSRLKYACENIDSLKQYNLFDSSGGFYKDLESADVKKLTESDCVETLWKYQKMLFKINRDRPYEDIMNTYYVKTSDLVIVLAFLFKRYNVSSKQFYDMLSYKVERSVKQIKKIVQ